MRKIFLMFSAILCAGCVGFNLNKEEVGSIPQSKSSKIYLLITTETNSAAGVTYQLPSEVSLSKTVFASANCDSAYTPELRRKFVELKSDVSTLQMACEFYKQLNSVSHNQVVLIDKIDQASDGVIFNVYLKRIVPSGTWRNIWSYASVFTLGLIPLWSFDQKTVLQASIQKGNSKSINFEATETWGYFGQTLLILAMPFAKNAKEAYRDSYRVLSEKMILYAAKNDLY